MLRYITLLGLAVAPATADVPQVHLDVAMGTSKMRANQKQTGYLRVGAPQVLRAEKGAGG